jgi:phosphoglycerate dehydrogenase-like enzyme
MGVGLVGKTFGSIGMGNIGAETFRLLRPFDMRLIAFDPYVDPELAASLGVQLVSLEDVFRQSDVLSVTCPLTPETRHIVNAEHLALMKPTAYLINSGRGPLVDEPALIRALQDGGIAGAGLDVFEQEPSPADNPLYHMDNVIVAPHSLCWTDQCFAGLGAADVKAVFEVMHGRVPRSVVNREVIERPGWQRKLEGFRARYGGGE